MNNDKLNQLPSAMTAEHRNALLTVLRCDLRDGWTIEEAAARHCVSVEFAKKATKPKRSRRSKEAEDGSKSRPDEDCRARIAELTNRIGTLEATVYELIDLAPRASGTA